MDVHFDHPSTFYCLSANRRSLKIADLDNEIVKGNFYESEMQSPTFPLFRIEKTIGLLGKGNKAQVMVKWLRWNKKFNSWLIRHR